MIAIPRFPSRFSLISPERPDPRKQNDRSIDSSSYLREKDSRESENPGELPAIFFLLTMRAVSCYICR